MRFSAVRLRPQLDGLPEANLASNVESVGGGRAVKTFFDLCGRIALVTGGSGGLGRHFALILAGACVKVMLAERRTEQIAAMAAELENAGGATAVFMDVTDVARVNRAWAETSERLGLPNVVVNNFGITRNEPALELTAADRDLVLDTNTRRAFLVSHAVARALIAAKLGGSIINIASVLGLRLAGRVASYSTSKAALLQLTRSLALEWGRYKMGNFCSSESGVAPIDRLSQRLLHELRLVAPVRCQIAAPLNISNPKYLASVS